MRKFFFISFFSLFCIAVSAQIQTSIFAGPQMSSSKYTINGKKQSTSYKYGFHAGAGLKIPFENRLYFSPAAFYSLKGYEVKLNQPSFPPDLLAIDNNTTIHTFETAFLLEYELGKQPDHFFLKVGPSLDFQLFGKEKFNRSDNKYISQDMKFSFGDYGRVAANAILQLGYQTKSGLLLSAQYSHGMGSINNADNGPRIKHRVFGISIGKFLAKKK
jgi:Outer membrane protein beta-barrel domain